MVLRDAATPAGPPPATMTSASSVIGVFLPFSSMNFMLVKLDLR